MQGHSVVDEAFHLTAIGDVGLEYRAFAKIQFFGEVLKTVDTARAKNDLCTLPIEKSCGRLTEAAARARDNDDLSFDPSISAVIPFSMVRCLACADSAGITVWR
jgi:hypothetical protein